MSLLYIDGFGHRNEQRYATVPSFKTWGGGRVSSSFGVAIITTAGAFKRIITASSEVYAGIAFNSANQLAYFSFFADTGATQHITVIINATGQIEVRRGGSTGTILATGTNSFASNAWWFMECRVIISDTVGVVQVRMNGQSTNEIDFLGDTKNAGTSNNVDAVSFGGSATTPNVSFADWYILDTAGTYNKSWLGDVAVRTLAPNANGTYSQLTNSAGNSTNNFTYVNEIPANNTNYVGSPTTGLVDTYNLADVPAAVSTVFGVQLASTASKSDAGLAQIKVRLRSGGNDYAGAARVLSTTYVESTDIYNADPATSAQWTVGGVNSLEIGAEVG